MEGGECSGRAGGDGVILKSIVSVTLALEGAEVARHEGCLTCQVWLRRMDSQAVVAGF